MFVNQQIQMNKTYLSDGSFGFTKSKVRWSNLESHLREKLYTHELLLNSNQSKNAKLTSFSLIAETLEAFTDDLVDKDNELLEIPELCLGTLAEWCNACLYVC